MPKQHPAHLPVDAIARSVPAAAHHLPAGCRGGECEEGQVWGLACPVHTPTKRDASQFCSEWKVYQPAPRPYELCTAEEAPDAPHPTTLGPHRYRWKPRETSQPAHPQTETRQPTVSHPPVQVEHVQLRAVEHGLGEGGPVHVATLRRWGISGEGQQSGEAGFTRGRGGVVRSTWQPCEAGKRGQGTDV